MLKIKVVPQNQTLDLIFPLRKRRTGCQWKCCDYDSSNFLRWLDETESTIDTYLQWFFFFYSTDSILHQKGVALTASSGRVLLDSSSGRAPKGSLGLMSVLLSPAVPTVGEVEHDTWGEISLVMAKNTRRKHSRDHWICWEGDSMFSYMLTGLLKLSWKSMASYSAIILFQDIPVHMVYYCSVKFGGYINISSCDFD